MLLLKIRTLLHILSKKELLSLEKMLCSCEEPGIEWNCVEEAGRNSDADVPVPPEPPQPEPESGSDSSVDPEDSPRHAATPPPTPQGYLIQNRVCFHSHRNRKMVFVCAERLCVEGGRR